MADQDYLLQAAAGALEGFERTYVPFKSLEAQDLYAQRREQRRLEAEEKMKREQSDYNLQNSMRLEEFKSSLPARKKTSARPKMFVTKADALKHGPYDPEVDVQLVDPGVDPNAPKQNLESRKVQGNLRDGILSLSTAMEIQSRRPDINKKTGIDIPIVGDLPSRLLSIGDKDAQRFMREIKNASDVISRYRTGAALTTSEERHYKTLLNDALAHPDIAAENLKKVHDFFVSVEEDLRAGKRTYQEESLASPSTESEIEEFPDE